MEVTDSNVEILGNYLANTLNADAEIRRKAEKDLEQIEVNPGYPLVLLRLIQKDVIPLQIRVSGAVMMKNFVKRNWQLAGTDGCRVSEADKVAVKQSIIPTMLTTPQAVQRQVGEAISLIGRVDFPQHWQELLPALKEQLFTGNYALINPCLHTADSMFKRYCHEMKSNELWLEIKYVLDNFAQPLTDLFRQTLEISKTMTASNSPANESKPVFDCLVFIAKIFYSLNSQDIPEFFEDNLAIWMPGFLELIQLNVPALATDDEEEPGVIEELRSQICDNIAMYAQKYEEEFGPHLSPFVNVVWQLLTSTGLEPKYDLLVSNAISFLSSVAEREQYKSLFEVDGALQQICQSVVVPNMQFRQSDEELFQDNPEEFIRKDIEGSDVDTRRRAAADLVKALCKFFEAKVTEIFGSYIQELFAQYAANPVGHWKQKDVAIYLVQSLANRGSTSRHGTTKTNELVNLSDFFRDHIGPELNKPDVNECPVLKAAALKYLVTFRNHLPKETLVVGVAACAKFAGSESVVVHSYAAHALERILTIRNRVNPSLPMITHADVKPVAQELLTNLFGIFDKEGSQENEYGMKAVMRTLIVLGAELVPFAEIILGRLTHILTLAAANPSKPYFNHYLFESICVLIKQVSAAQPGAGSQFEAALFPPFQEVLQKDVTEFMPYCFQILAMMLNLHAVGSGIPDSYNALFPFLLMPALWDRHGSVPALVQLLRAYIKVGVTQIIQANQLNPVLGIFQKLVASKQRDHEGFNIINGLLEYSPPGSLTESVKGMFVVLFNRLQANKTTKFVRNLIYIIALCAIKLTPQVLIQTIDSIQEGLFGMITSKVLMAEMQKISGNMEKKVVCVGVTQMITMAPQFYPNGQYSEHWSGLLECIIGLFELPEADSGDDDQLLEDLSVTGYAAAFSQLAFAQQTTSDPTAVPDPKIFLVKQIKLLSDSHPGQIGTLVGKLEPKAQEYLNAYLAASGVSI